MRRISYNCCSLRPLKCQALCSSPPLSCSQPAPSTSSQSGETEAQENEATPCWEVGLISRSTLSMNVAISCTSEPTCSGGIEHLLGHQVTASAASARAAHHFLFLSGLYGQVRFHHYPCPFLTALLVLCGWRMVRSSFIIRNVKGRHKRCQTKSIQTQF